ncbi:hypothetical protein EX30DRAFT_349243 [Ascodesmis nigricans]|uniref:Uncharacterized protein n=1 Tax=Ascodesmis nigricans TaxID=341454 RepID=A0A4S2MVY5_9PEZI|nr:hypothetical protein EX30DRAFT_349243 [Ascodesmis nigricans]
MYGTSTGVGPFKKGHANVNALRRFVDNWPGKAALSASIRTETPHGNVLQVAAARGSEELVRLLLDHGANVNARSGSYGAALYATAAAVNGNESIIQLLLDHGATD